MLLVILVCLILACAGLWLRVRIKADRTAQVAHATQSARDTLTARHGDELGRLVEEHERRLRTAADEQESSAELTDLIVYDYVATRARVYGAVDAYPGEGFRGPFGRPCGFCAVYVFVREERTTSWELAAVAPMMGSYKDHLRDWDLDAPRLEGLIDERPEFIPCPYGPCHRP